MKACFSAGEKAGTPHTGRLRINEGTGGIRTANDIRAINTDCMRRRKPDSLRNVSMILKAYIN